MEAVCRCSIPPVSQDFGREQTAQTSLPLSVYPPAPNTNMMIDHFIILDHDFTPYSNCILSSFFLKHQYLSLHEE